MRLRRTGAPAPGARTGAVGQSPRSLSTPAGPERVRAAAAERGVAIEIRRTTGTARTAEDAARELGCEVGAIVKSLAFIAAGEPVVVLVSGVDRVDEARLALALGVPSVRRASASEARAATGYAIGGVPPFGHARPLRVVMDRGLERGEVVWAAAGLPDAVFPISPADLARASAAERVDVRA